jgi:hypothetical protein
LRGSASELPADRFGINARTVSKILKFSVPPGYVRTKPPFRPKLDEFTGVIDAILAADKDRPAEEAAAYIQADLRAAPRRARIYGQDHDREGLRCRLAPADAGDSCRLCIRQGMPRPTSAKRSA